MQRRQDLEYMVCVYECGCKDLGKDRQLCMVLLGRVASAVMAQDCARVVELLAAGVQQCAQGSKSCGDDCIKLCALVHTGCTQQDRFSEALTARSTGFVVDVGDKDC